MNTGHSMRAGWRNLLLVSGLLAALAHAQVANPLNVNLSEDTDQDGISNADEVALGLDPYNPYNGISALDGAAFIVAWERYLGASSSTVDTDGDGWSDFDEVMVYQTNLFDERSLPGPISNLSAATTSQPVAASTPTATPSTSLIRNGDFSKTNISTWIDGKKLKGYNGSGFEWAAGSVEGWSAYAGSTIEVWNTGTRVVELNGDKSNYGIQQKVEIAKPGAYLLTWRSLGRTQEAAPAKNKKTPPAPNNLYFVQVQVGEGSGGRAIKTENFTAGGDRVFVFQLSENDLTAANGKGIYIAFIPTNGSNSYGSLISGVNLVPFSAHLAVDRDRDGVISPSSYQDMTTVGRPFRFWVNDDEDSGEAGDSGERDVDGTYGFRYVQGPRGGLERRRYLRSNSQSTGYVDGSRDLVDFFPVSLDIQQVLAVFPPDARTKYKLKHAEGALNFTYTDLARDKANDYLQRVLDSGFGLDASQAARNATTWQITAEGVELSPEFLKKEGFSAGGVILVECRSATDKPLVLVVEKDGVVIAELSAALKICAVEEMYRHADLTGLAKEYDGGSITPPQPPKPTNMGEPAGLPDSEMNDKYFVFVHGYNVNAYQARGWNAEVFKRLYALGSRARFIGVTWNGDTGLDYHKAVFHAFLAGDGLRVALGLPTSADVTVAAHSLGNMLVSHAIQSGGFTPTRYYMINAAVPVEAYDSSVLEQKGPGSAYEAMTESGWKGKDDRMFASNWHRLFDPAYDSRGKLGWKGIFKEVVTGTITTNFYTPGEDVVENPKSSSSLIILDMIHNFDTERGAWGHQEMIKGGAGLGRFAFKRVQGGWNRRANLDAPVISSDELGTNPRFGLFLEGDLFSDDEGVGSIKAAEPRVLYDLLARGLPALSYAAAANPVPSLVAGSSNFNMETQGCVSGVWPLDGHGDDRLGRWNHSDFKNVSLPYVARMYQSMIDKGNLENSP